MADPSREWETGSGFSIEILKAGGTVTTSWTVPGFLDLFSWCFSGEQGGSREDTSNCHALRSLRPRGLALEEAT